MYEVHEHRTCLLLAALTISLAVMWPICAAVAQENSDVADSATAESSDSGATTEQATAAETGESASPTEQSPPQSPDQSYRREFRGERPEGGFGSWRGRDGGGPERGPSSGGGGEGEPGQPDDGLVSVSFNNAELRQIAQFYMQQLKKPVIPEESIQGVRITILSDQRLPLRDALQLIGTALRQKGVMIVESPRQIEFLPIAMAMKVNRRVIGPEQSVADLEDQSQIVDKVFELQHYRADRLKDIILPMLPDYAAVMADPNINRLTVTEAAANLLRIEQLVKELDVPASTPTIDHIFQIKEGDASEIVSMLRVILAGTLDAETGRAFLSQPDSSGRSTSGRSSSRDSGRDRGNSGMPFPGMQQPPSPTPSSGSSAAAASTTILVEPSKSPILLHADIGRNWIIAVASPSAMELIQKWIEQLDQPKTTEEPYALFDVQHADMDELGNQLTATIESIPDADVRNSVRIIPFTKSRQIMVYGSQRGRQLVQDLLKQLDVETSQYRIIKEISLQYAEAESVAEQINDLFAEGGGSDFPFFFGGRNQRQTEQDVKVTYDMTRNSITVMTDPNRMLQIEKVIAEQWDRPLDLEEVQPKVYYLRYTDPVQVQTLLENMFSKSQSTSSGSWWNPTTTTTNAVGRLFGQFSFEALSGTNTLIVSSTSKANYKVIDELLTRIDTPQEAGLPLIIELKHANAEEVAEQLNATFSEPGTTAQVTRAARGLSSSVTSATSNSDSTSSGNNNNNNNQGDSDQTDSSMMSFWWAESRTSTDEQPISNLIGKPRFVPVNRRNALMILAPMAYSEPLSALVTDMDKPGSQVLIQAIITEVQHDDESTLGMRLASDPSILSDSRLSDQAIGATIGNTTTGTRTFSDYFTGSSVINADVNLNMLIQLLIRKVNMKILNEPRIYTSDNQEAYFFDGQRVPTVVGDQSSNLNNNNIVRSFEYKNIGTLLQVRPHITQEGDVDLEVNLELSSVVTGETVFGNFIFNSRQTSTHVTLKDGQTVVISGIITKEDSTDIRKLPILGDIPGLGVLFRSTEKTLNNREVVAFITPHIINTTDQKADDLSQQNEQWLQRLRDAMRGKDENADQGKPTLEAPKPDDQTQADEPSTAEPPPVEQTPTDEPAPPPEAVGQPAS
ncbi:MAG: hypothetical protein IT445_14085 [Phycisphaeraceae bacterium]|nr:hypothetical protein [Phycisphaeraceae bacterium]